MLPRYGIGRAFCPSIKHARPLEEIFSLAHWKLPFWVPRCNKCIRFSSRSRASLLFEPSVSTMTIKLTRSAQPCSIEMSNKCWLALSRYLFLPSRSFCSNNSVWAVLELTRNAGPRFQLSIHYLSLEAIRRLVDLRLKAKK
jgi:hypothetical protein